MLTALRERMLSDGREEKGFSLIELIIVIVIIGILTAIAIPVYGSIQENARMATMDTAASTAYTSAVQHEAFASMSEVEILETLNNESDDEVFIFSLDYGEGNVVEESCFYAAWIDGDVTNNYAYSGSDCNENITSIQINTQRGAHS